MRGQQLSRILADLRVAIGRSSDATLGVDDAERLKAVIRRIQDELYEAYTWPFLRQVFPRIPLYAGQRYFDMPDLLNVDRIETTAVWWNNLPTEIHRGIGFDEYATFDSENDVRSDPALRWDVRSIDNKDNIEIWPVPASSVQTLQFTGIRKLRPLRDDNDVADLDDNLIVLTAAVELHADPNKAAMLEKKAGALFGRLKAGANAGSSDIRLGMGSTRAVDRGRAVVRIAGR